MVWAARSRIDRVRAAWHRRDARLEPAGRRRRRDVRLDHPAIGLAAWVVRRTDRHLVWPPDRLVVTAPAGGRGPSGAAVQTTSRVGPARDKVRWRLNDQCA